MKKLFEKTEGFAFIFVSIVIPFILILYPVVVVYLGNTSFLVKLILIIAATFLIFFTNTLSSVFQYAIWIVVFIQSIMGYIPKPLNIITYILFLVFVVYSVVGIVSNIKNSSNNE